MQVRTSNDYADGVVIVDPTTGMPGSGRTKSVSITRPANVTPYSINDAIGDVGGSAILEFTNIGAASDNLLITSVEVAIDTAALPTANGNLTLRLYNAAPAAIADNAAWDLVAGDRTKWLGDISIGTLADKGSTAYIRLDQINAHIALSETSLFAILTTDAAITFAENSTVLKITVHAITL